MMPSPSSPIYPVPSAHNLRNADSPPRAATLWHHMLIRFALSLLSVALLSIACTGGPAQGTLTNPPRHQPSPPPPSLASKSTTLSFTPGAAFLHGIKGEELPLGGWVAAYPNPHRWPADEPLPVIAVGQIVERRGDHGRVELLSVTDSVRTETLSPVILSGRDALPSLTKRLSLVLEGSPSTAPIGEVDLVTGEELYAVLPQSGRSQNARLASQFSGLVTLKAEGPHRSRIQHLTGPAPLPGDALVLVGVHPSVPLPIEVLISVPAHLKGEEASIALQGSLKDQLRLQGIQEVTLQSLSTPVASNEEALELLRGASSEKLQVILWSESGSSKTSEPRWRLSSNWRRVEARPPYPLQASIEVSSPDQESFVRDISIHLQLLRGEYAAAAYGLEQRLRERISEEGVAAWSALAPPLIDTYAKAHRLDWATEILLAYEGALSLSKSAPPGSKEHRLLAALALGDAARIGAALNALPRSPATPYDPRTLSLIVEHLLRNGDIEGAEHWRRRLQEQGQPESASTRLTSLILDIDFAIAGKKPTAKLLSSAQNSAQNLGEHQKLQVDSRALQLRLEEEPQEALEALAAFVQRADDAGEHEIAQRTLLRTAQELLQLRPEIAQMLLRRAIDSARRSRRIRNITDIGALLEQLHPKTFTPFQTSHLHALAALDLRARIGLYSIYEASKIKDIQRARHLLVLARALFISIGDPINVAVSDFNRAHLEKNNGHPVEAREHLQKGARFEERAGYRPLSTLREQLEQDLNPPKK